MYLTDNNGILDVPEDPKFIPDPKGYSYHCFNKMKEFRNNVAQIDASTNKSETYGEIFQKSVRIALHMKSMGIETNDVITLCTDTHIETCLPFWAAMFSGIKTANLDPSLELNDLKYLTNLVKPKLIFCIPQSVEILETTIEINKLDTKIVVFGDTNKHISFKEFLKPQIGEEDFKPNIPNSVFDTLCIFFSSGTTGLPKAVCLTHYGILASLYIIKHLFYFETVLYYTSPYWISNMLILSAALVDGGKRIITKGFNPDDVVKTIQEFKVTCSFMAPTLLCAVINASEKCNIKYNTSSLHSIMLGGGNLGEDYIKQLRKLLPNTYCNQCYGSTDTTGIFSGFDTTTDLKEMEEKILSSGKMVPGTQCKVVDIETNKILGKNQQGELLIKSNRLMKCYYNEPQKTLEVFDDDGFLRTGDVVYYDDDYFFFIVNRVKEMFKYKSWHIVPTELEAILVQHPAVKEALVIGFPHPEDGDHPMACIILKDGVSVSENDIVQFFNDRVGDRKKLRGGIKFLNHFPKTPTGKYSRIKLRTLIINNEI